MAEQVAARQSISVDEYLRLEETSDVRHEYVGGMLYAMVGASKRHARIVLKIGAKLLEAEHDGPCEVVTNDVKLRVADDVIYYPDILVTCDPEDDDPHIATRPCLVVEVLSPSTANVDRREKLLNYRRLPSLRAYLLVHQDEPRVERHWRDDADAWWSSDIQGEGVVPCPCLDVELSLADIYAGLPPVEGNREQRTGNSGMSAVHPSGPR